MQMVIEMDTTHNCGTQVHFYKPLSEQQIPSLSTHQYINISINLCNLPTIIITKIIRASPAINLVALI